MRRVIIVALGFTLTLGACSVSTSSPTEIHYEWNELNGVIVTVHCKSGAEHPNAAELCKGLTTTPPRKGASDG